MEFIKYCIWCMLDMICDKPKQPFGEALVGIATFAVLSAAVLGVLYIVLLVANRLYKKKKQSVTDMIFDNNVSREKIEKYESDCLEKVSNLSLISSLKEELSKRNLTFTLEILHVESDLKKYSSHLAIDILDANGERVCERDEPNCCLSLCEPICFMHCGHVIGIDLTADKEFLQSLKLLIEQVKSIR